MAETWRPCSACKEPIALGAIYHRCSVSTCNRKRTALYFCSVTCWEIHLPTERHREAWAIEERAPMTPEPPPEATPTKSERSRPASDRGPTSAPARARSAPLIRKRRPVTSGETEILVVVSRLKQYVRERAGFNTSDNVMPLLSDRLRSICEEAIRNARAAERQTVLDRDVPRE